MKSMSAFLSSLTLLALLSSPALAATSKDVDSTGDGKPHPDIYVPVPAQVLDFTGIEGQIPAKKATHFEVTASSWAPNNYTSGSYLAGTNSFHTEGMGKLAINLWTDTWHTAGLVISPKFGLGFDQFVRQGQVEVSGQNSTVSQDVNLYSASLGIELTPQAEWRFHLKPYADLALMPTYAQSPQSQFDDGISNFYFNAQEVGGITWSSPWVANNLGVANFGIEIGVEGVQGLGSSPLTGYGVLAGTRIDL